MNDLMWLLEANSLPGFVVRMILAGAIGLELARYLKWRHALKDAEAEWDRVILRRDSWYERGRRVSSTIEEGLVRIVPAPIWNERPPDSDRADAFGYAVRVIMDDVSDRTREEQRQALEIAKRWYGFEISPQGEEEEGEDGTG